MSYIQNKLDEFGKIFTQYKNIKDGSMDSFFEKYIMVILEESYNKGKTDYHNHIVEILEKERQTWAKESIGEIAVKSIISLLQDTNPKE